MITLEDVMKNEEVEAFILHPHNIKIINMNNNIFFIFIIHPP